MSVYETISELRQLEDIRDKIIELEADGDFSRDKVAEYWKKYEKKKAELETDSDRLIFGLWSHYLNDAGRIDSVDRELKRLKKLKSDLKKKQEWRSDVLTALIGEGNKYKDGVIDIGWNAQSVELLEPDEDIPDQYCTFETKTTRKISKAEIANDLKAGASLPFAKLTRSIKIKRGKA